MMIAWFCAAALAADPVVRIKGNLVQDVPGDVRVELLVEQGPGQHPLLAWETTLVQPGPFVLEVPMGLAKVHLRAAIDTKGDGIGPDDPQLLTPIVLMLNQPVIEGVRLEIGKLDPTSLP